MSEVRSNRFLPSTSDNGHWTSDTPMRPLAEAACELPWLAPCAGSLVTLTRQQSCSSPWESLRGDPGLVLLLLRQPAQRGRSLGLSFYSSLLREPGVLELAAQCVAQPEPGFVDWLQPTLLPIYRASLACARLAETIASQTDACDAQHAWVGGLLAPLGWLAAAAVERDQVVRVFQSPATPSESAKLQQRLWGLDASAIARRLASRWQLPGWLSAVVGHLGLPVDAVRAVARMRIFLWLSSSR